MSQLTDEQIAQFAAEGYTVMQGALSNEELEGLRGECARRLEVLSGLMDATGATTLGLTHRDQRYFLHAPYDESPALEALLFGDTMVGLAAELLGPEVYLFLELFVVKTPERGAPMAWHQDSGYLMGLDHRPYLSIWVALDDMTAANGTIAVLPFARADGAEVRPHHKDRSTNDLVGYDGDDEGDALEVSAGSLVLMSSTLLHRSLPNTSAAPRRAFLASYSCEPIVNADGSPWNLAVPCPVGNLDRARASRSVT